MVGLRQPVAPVISPVAPRPRTAPARRSAWPAAGLAYLLAAIALWWHTWALGAGTHLASGSVDPVQSVWFLGWALHALVHGTNPFFTEAMYAPRGVNLLDNTSTLALGAALSPITGLFGPVVTFNVAATLAPAASALAAFFAAGRYVSYRPAAFVAGLCYGFGPFLATDLQLGHLNLTFSAVPPLVLVCLDELFVTQRRNPKVIGAWLGALLVVQFFISTEVLAIMAVVAIVALAILALSHRGACRERIRRAAPGVAVAGAITFALLAYPAWFAAFGPAHVSGPVFGSTAITTATLRSTVIPGGGRPAVGFISGGNGAYLGIPLLVILCLGWIVWRRRRELVFFTRMAAACFVFSLGPSLHVTNADTGIPLPAALLAHVPLLWSIMPSRFGIFVDLFAALSLGIVLERLRALDVGALAKRIRNRPTRPPSPRFGVVVSLGTAAVVLATLAAARPWPYPVHPVGAPAIFERPRFQALVAGGVVSTYPPDAQRQGGPLLGQVLDDDEFDMTGGYAIVPGPSGRSTEEPAPSTLQLLYTAAGMGTLSPTVSPAEKEAITATIARLHLRAVVVDRSAPGASGLDQVLTESLGAATLRVGGDLGWIFPRR